MKNIIPKDKKIRVIALGCGSKIPELLMKEGSSAWLEEIELLYSFNAISRYFGGIEQLGDWQKNSKTVSFDMTNHLMEGVYVDYPESEKDIITFIFTAALGYKGQREGRVNQYFVEVYNDGETTSHNMVFNDLHKTREEQEEEVASYILHYFLKERTQLVFAGSFNPFHDAHKFLYESAGELNLSSKPIIIDLTSEHPEKGKIEMEELQARQKQIEEVLEGEIKFYLTTAATFKQKYEIYNKQYPKENITFLIGYDVWEKYGESFERDFKNVDNVSFLVFTRFVEKVKVKPSRLLHPYSFQIKLPEELLRMSSTTIRENGDNTIKTTTNKSS